MRLLLLPLFFVFHSCSGEPDRLGRLADAYADVLRYRDASSKVDTTAIRQELDSLLAGYGLTPQEFLAGFHELADDPASIQPFFQKVEERLAATSSAASESADRPGN